MVDQGSADVRSLSDDDLIEKLCGSYLSDRTGATWSEVFLFRKMCEACRAELLRRIAAAERPAEGDTVVISKTALYRAEVWAKAYAQLHWEHYDQHALGEIQTALAASSAPADAALGQGEEE